VSVTIINGGTQGLGEATARELARRGATGLVLAGRSAERGVALAAQLSAAGTPAVFLETEMADVDAPERIVNLCDERFGVVHGVVNVAAMTDRSTVWNATPDHWDQMMAINVRAPFFVLQRAAELMRREGVRGSVVNIGSVCGHGGPTVLLAYSVSKGAMAVMTKSAAFSLMRHGIRVNQINPGWMDTESEDIVQRRWHGASDGWLEQAEAIQPYGRLIKPPELARVIAFYLSDDESGMMTGNVVDYDQTIQGGGFAPVPSPEETPE
jgi:NAD(P)-dependent dehydrogenase (short-subunit alcohol dehydrogenase family)